MPRRAPRRDVVASHATAADAAARTATQQLRLAFFVTALGALCAFARDDRQEDATVLAVALGDVLGGLLAEALAGIPLTAAIPTPTQFEADLKFQAAQAEAASLLNGLLANAGSDFCVTSIIPNTRH
jgi:hypothetical protein